MIRALYFWAAAAIAGTLTLISAIYAWRTFVSGHWFLTPMLTIMVGPSLLLFVWALREARGQE